MKMFAYLLFITFSVVITTYAQIPNSSFESWTNGEPDGWSSNNSSLYSSATIYQSSDAESGSSAVKIAVGSYLGIDVGPLLYTGTMTNSGFKISQRYASLSGYYKFHQTQGDVLSIAINMTSNGTLVGSGLQDIAAGTSAYIHFNINLTYSGSSIPDTCKILFVIAGKDSSQSGHFGSYALIDNLSFSPATAVQQVDEPVSYMLYQNYPNPFNPTTTIRYAVPDAEHVILKIYDVLGREVATLVNEEQQAGMHSVQLSADNYKLTSGVYIYTLKAGTFNAAKKIILMK